MVEDVYLQDPDKQPNLLTPQIETKSAQKKTTWLEIVSLVLIWMLSINSTKTSACQPHLHTCGPQNQPIAKVATSC